MNTESELIEQINITLVKAKMSKKELSEAVNEKSQNICNYLAGRQSMRLSTFIKIANYLDLDLNKNG